MLPPTDPHRLWVSKFFDIASAAVMRRSPGSARKPARTRPPGDFRPDSGTLKRALMRHARVRSKKPLGFQARERPQPQSPRWQRVCGGGNYSSENKSPEKAAVPAMAESFAFHSPHPLTTRTRPTAPQVPPRPFRGRTRCGRSPRAATRDSASSCGAPPRGPRRLRLTWLSQLRRMRWHPCPW